MVQPCLLVAKENVWKSEILPASKSVLSALMQAYAAELSCTIEAMQHKPSQNLPWTVTALNTLLMRFHIQLLISRSQEVWLPETIHSYIHRQVACNQPPYCTTGCRLTLTMFLEQTAVLPQTVDSGRSPPTHQRVYTCMCSLTQSYRPQLN